MHEGHRTRTHRLPKRLDYALIPAPLDLSLPSITEKSPLPAIIVTPSSPAFDNDYSIAFLIPPPKPTLFHRIRSSISGGKKGSEFGSPSTPDFVIRDGSCVSLPLALQESGALPPHPSESEGILRLEEGEPLLLGGSSGGSSTRGLPSNKKLRTAIILVLISFLLLCHLLTHSLLAKGHFLDYTRSTTPHPHTASSSDNAAGSRGGRYLPQNLMGPIANVAVDPAIRGAVAGSDDGVPTAVSTKDSDSDFIVFEPVAVNQGEDARKEAEVEETKD